MDIDMSSRETFQYERLDGGHGAQNDMRLLMLLPAASDEQTIQVELFHVNMKKVPDFQALSYAWGDPSSVHDLICNGRRLPIIENAMHALRALRSRVTTALFWVDAICINQNDLAERSHQVQLMRKIYSAARSTVMWVGLEGRYSRQAFDLISELTIARRSTFSTMSSSSVNLLRDRAAVENYRNSIPALDFPGWKGMTDMLDSGYFHRCWIILDVVWSKSLILRCGSFTVPFADFCYGLKSYLDFSYPNNIKTDRSQIVLNLEKLRQDARRVSPDLFTIIDTVRNMLVTDVRDKAFIAASLLEPSVDNSFGLLMADYSKSVREIYLEYSQLLCQKPENYYYCMSMAEAAPSISNSINFRLPSWTLDLSFPRQVYLLNQPGSAFMSSSDWDKQTVPLVERLSSRISNLDLSIDQRSAQVDIRLAEVKASPATDNDDQELHVGGSVIDKIDVVGDYMPPRSVHDKYTTDGANSIFFLRWFDIAQTLMRSRYKGDNERLLQDWIETIQAKGCRLWEEAEPCDHENLIRVAKSWLRHFEEEDEEETEELRQFNAACLPSHGRRFGITRRGHLCLIPRLAKAGDVICVLWGSNVPFVFRRVETHYKNIGECYVHGAMQGEASRWEDTQKETFVLR